MLPRPSGVVVDNEKLSISAPVDDHFEKLIVFKQRHPRLLFLIGFLIEHVNYWAAADLDRPNLQPGPID
jgi:hypothetical protein